MDVIEMVRYLNSLDGPHMSLQALAPYLGVSQAALSEYLAGKHKPKKETMEKMEQGMNELVQEIVGEWNGIRNRHVQ